MRHRMLALLSLTLATPVSAATGQITGDWSGTCVRDGFKPARIGIHLHGKAKTVTTPALADRSPIAAPIYAFRSDRRARTVFFQYNSRFDGRMARFSGQWTPDFQHLFGTMEVPENEVTVACQLHASK